MVLLAEEVAAELLPLLPEEEEVLEDPPLLPAEELPPLPDGFPAEEELAEEAGFVVLLPDALPLDCAVSARPSAAEEAEEEVLGAAPPSPGALPDLVLRSLSILAGLAEEADDSLLSTRSKMAVFVFLSRSLAACESCRDLASSAAPLRPEVAVAPLSAFSYLGGFILGELRFPGFTLGMTKPLYRPFLRVILPFE